MRTESHMDRENIAPRFRSATRERRVTLWRQTKTFICITEPKPRQHGLLPLQRFIDAGISR